MRVVVAADSFKGSFGAADVCAAIRRGLFAAGVHGLEVVCLPVADGGEGTVEAMLSAGGELRHCSATDPQQREMTAFYGILPDGSGVVETAAASGLTLVRAGDDPWQAGTYGTGLCIRAALEAGCRRVLVGMGGSATVDGGMGAARALGAMFYDDKGQLLAGCAADLEKVAHIDVSVLHPALLSGAQIVLLSDVQNPLCGETGAAHVFGPQKGFSKADVPRLDSMMNAFSAVVEATCGRALADAPGAGAAGGFPVALMGLCGARIQPGISTVLEVLGLEEAVQGADLVITGEGRMDAQTALGKAPAGVARVAGLCGVPVVAIVGAMGEGVQAVFKQGIASVFSIAPGPITLEEAMADTGPLLESCAERVLRLVMAGDGQRR